MEIALPLSCEVKRLEEGVIRLGGINLNTKVKILVIGKKCSTFQD